MRPCRGVSWKGSLFCERCGTERRIARQLCVAPLLWGWGHFGEVGTEGFQMLDPRLCTQ